MVHIEDIYSLTDFQRNVKAHVARLKETGRPHVLTVNGKAEVIVQYAKSYQENTHLLANTTNDKNEDENQKMVQGLI